MAARRGKKDRTLKDLLTKPVGPQTTVPTLPPGTGATVTPAEMEAPVTRFFLGSLVASLRDDLYTLKKDLA
ncbi:hypothetical protein NDU88_000895 [Pleurodeles waltl]|uniref:Uncharacterized protein n=1 Tax=Pleurodeles waltl TaxID=8319 RepID=A0AAV7VA71_PLEWA|nr:hypothetical protein NDU88_000895 [Pleurodeles waltl]